MKSCSLSSKRKIYPQGVNPGPALVIPKGLGFLVSQEVFVNLLVSEGSNFFYSLRHVFPPVKQFPVHPRLSSAQRSRFSYYGLLWLNCRRFYGLQLLLLTCHPSAARTLLRSASLLTLPVHRRIVALTGEPNPFAALQGVAHQWLRVPRWFAEDPSNLLQVMLAKGCLTSPFLPFQVHWDINSRNA